MGSLFVLGMKRYTLEAQLDVVLEGGAVAKRLELPRLDADVKAPVVESFAIHSSITMMAMLECDEEVFGVMLGNGDVVRSNAKLEAKSFFDDFQVNFRSNPTDPS